MSLAATPLTHDQLMTKLEVEKHRLQSALDRFYAVDMKDQIALEAAALDVATVIRVLVHDTSASCALLKQCDPAYLNKEIAFDPLLPTPEPTPAHLPPGTRVMSITIPINMSLGRGFAKFIRKDPAKAPTRVRLQDWWTATVWDSGNNKVSNSELVRGIVNKDGGAHVDETGMGQPAYRAAKGQGQIATGSWGNKVSDTARLGNLVAIAGDELVAYITEHFGGMR